MILRDIWFKKVMRGALMMIWRGNLGRKDDEKCPHDILERKIGEKR